MTFDQKSVSQNCLKIANAFTKFSKEYFENGKSQNGKTKLAVWEIYSKQIKASKLNFGASVTNLFGYFGIGGVKRSPLLKKPEGLRKYYNILIASIKEINKYINPSIKFDAEGLTPLFENNGDFKLHFSGEKIELIEVQIEPFIGFYWSHINLLGKFTLNLYKGIGIAELEVLYSPPERKVELIGSFTNIKGAYTVRLEDKSDNLNMPLTQITFLRSPESIKDCYFASYCTAHRGSNILPVAGAMLLVRKDKYDDLDKGMFKLEAFATYYLRNMRFEVGRSGFDINQILKNQFSSDDATVNSYLELSKYEGIYRGDFINPKQKTYEPCYIKISRTGEAQILVHANATAKPFSGIVKLNERKVLIISYDFKGDNNEMNDFRMKLIFDVSRYQLGNEIIYGLMNGLELHSGEPMSSCICISRIKKGDYEFTKSQKKITVIHMEDKKGFQMVEKDLKKKKIFDYFFGKTRTDYTSIGVLTELLKKNS